MAQTTYLMPVLIAVFALNFNQGIGIYWVTQSAVMVLQVFSMMGWGGLKVPPWFPGAGWRPKNSPLRFSPVAPVPAGAALVSGGAPVDGTIRRAPSRPQGQRPRGKARRRPRR
jgi:hypothetical protein